MASTPPRGYPMVTSSSGSAMKRLVPVIAGILTAAVFVGIVGMARLSAGSDAERTFEGQIRWANVSLQFPPGSPFSVLRNPPLSPEHDRWEIIAYVEAASPPYPQLKIDAETGEILEDTLSQQYPDEVKKLLTTLVIDSGLPQLWPFVDEPPPDAITRSGSFVIPDPGSGMTIAFVENLCDPGDPSCAERTILVAFRESAMHIDASDGRVLSWDGVAPSHREAFQRYLDTVQVVVETPVAQ